MINCKMLSFLFTSIVLSIIIIIIPNSQSIEIGRNTNIQDGTVIHVASEQQGTKGKLNTIIGDGVTVGHMALLHACKIEDNAFVGMKACVMDGAVVRSHGMLAAGALLTPGKIVGGGELWAGQPAKLMRKLTEKEIENIYNSAENYAILAACYRQNLLTEFK